MAVQRYVGITDPRGEFEALAPASKALIRLMTKVRPQGPDYLILLAAHTALNTAATHFTGDPFIYGGRPH